MAKSAAPAPTNRFTLPASTNLVNLDGEHLTEPDPDVPGKTRKVTLGIVLRAALLSEAKAEGVTLTVLDRLDLARRFHTKAEVSVKTSTNEQLKKLVVAAFGHLPILSGQALELLGEEASADL